MPELLSPDERTALDDLLPPDRQTGRLVDDLITAAREAQERRIRNSRNGGAVIAALHRELRSWRELEDLTGIPVSSARRWLHPTPGTAGQDPTTTP